MVTDPVTIGPEADLGGLDRLMKAKKIDATPVLQDGRLLGIVTTRDMAHYAEENWPNTKVSDAMSKKLVVGYVGETLYEALNRMTNHNISHLMVVEKRHPEKLVGFLAMHNIATTYDLQKRTVRTNGD